MRRRVVVCTVLALLPMAQAGGGGAAPGCMGTTRIDVAGVQNRLTAAEALWKRRGPAHYTLTTYFGSVWMQFTLVVRAETRLTGQTTTARLSLPGQAAPPPVVESARPERARQYTVPGLFAQVQRLLGQLDVPGQPPCGTLEVSFDPADGHVRVLSSHVAGTLDDEFSLATSSLVPLN